MYNTYSNTIYNIIIKTQTVNELKCYSIIYDTHFPIYCTYIVFVFFTRCTYCLFSTDFEILLLFSKKILHHRMTFYYFNLFVL